MGNTNVACSNGGSITIDGTNAVTDAQSCNGEVTIPASVTSIGWAGLAFATSMTAINVDPASATFTSTGGVLFNSSGTTLVAYPGGRPGTYTVPGTVTTIGLWAFGGATGITGVTIPPSVTSIAMVAFRGASNLAEVTFTEGSQLQSIGQEAFEYDYALTTFTFPSTVTTIGSAIFYNTTNLTSLFFAGNAPSNTQPDSFSGMGAGTTAYRFSGASGFSASPWLGLPVAFWMPAPGAPSATAGAESATVSMTTPSLGPSPTSFTVTAVEDPSKGCTVTGASGSCTVSGLTGGASYTFTARSTDGNATSAPSAASTAVTPSSAPAPPTPDTPATPPASTPPAESTAQQSTTGAPTPVAAPARLRQSAPQQRGSTVVSTGAVPDGATSVVQLASTGSGQMALGARARARVATRCPITSSGTQRTYRCSARLHAGRWTLVTQAKAGSTVIAQSVTRVRVKGTRNLPVTG